VWWVDRFIWCVCCVYGVLCVPADVSITHLAFGKEFTKAIEMKQVAQQEAERSKFLVMRAEQEKQVRPSTVCAVGGCWMCVWCG
jgi:hypothetical protein